MNQHPTKDPTEARKSIDLQKRKLDLKESKSFAWKSKLKESNRSVLITVHNCIEKPLIRTQYALKSGSWVHLPPEKIQPHSQISFATASLSILSGTEGFVYYEIEEAKQHRDKVYRFLWDNPLLGAPDFKWLCPKDRAVDVHGKAGSHAEVEYFVVNKKKVQPSTSSSQENRKSSVSSLNSSLQGRVKSKGNGSNLVFIFMA